jgi:hypothetical protein
VIAARQERGKRKSSGLKIASTSTKSHASSGGSRLNHSCGDQILAVHFQTYAREGFWRRAAKDGAIDGRENSAVTRARKDVFFRAIKYRTGGVSAESAEREKRAFRWTQQEAGMLVIRVGNDFHPADRDVSHMRYHFDRIGILSGTKKDDESAESRGQASGGQILRKLAAGYSIVDRICDESSPGIRC